MAKTITPPAETFSERLAKILALLVGGGPGRLRLDARTESGIGHVQLDIDRVEPGWMPIPLLRLIEEGNDWFVQFQPAIAAAGGEAPPLRMEIAFARFKFPMQLKRRMNVADADAKRAILQRLEGFAARPTVIIDAVDEIVALWKLAAPLDFRHEQRAQIYLLQDNLAMALNATTAPQEQRKYHATTMETNHRPDSVAANSPLSWLPLCGRHRFAGAHAARPLVKILNLDSSRVYTADALHTATAGAAVPQLDGGKK
ncbi:MAG: hypothetical protein LAO77_24170 [Acidobacteriia bacterium]|nr:hypothetical protein [Terriglobia bacterium]